MDIATISFLTLMANERQKKQAEAEKAEREQRRKRLRKLDEESSDYCFYLAWNKIMRDREANKR